MGSLKERPRAACGSRVFLCPLSPAVKHKCFVTLDHVCWFSPQELYAWKGLVCVVEQMIRNQYETKYIQTFCSGEIQIDLLKFLLVYPNQKFPSASDIIIV